MRDVSTLGGHLWIVGASRADRAAAVREVVPQAAPDGASAAFHPVTSHRRVRGPYGGTADLLGRIVPSALGTVPALVKAHDVELLSVAPGLAAVVNPSRETLTSLAIPEERTRFYGPGRTRRLAHGVVDFLRAYAQDLAAAGGAGPAITAWFDGIHEADATEQELLAIMLRRIDPTLLRVIVGTTPDRLPAHASELESALGRLAHRVAAAPVVQPDGRRGEAELGDAFIASDGTSDDPAEQAAYLAAPADIRAAHHDARADLLDRTAAAEFSLGAIPYHRANGSDPSGAGLRTVLKATGHCVDMGFYHAVTELGSLALELADPDEQPNEYCDVSTRLTTAFALLGDTARAEQIYFDLRGRYTTPMVHLFANYAMGMLYTRHRSPTTRDHAVARVHLNTAIAIASVLPDTSRAFQRVFQQNGLALVEMHTGDLAEAERLVDEGIAQLDAELAEGEHQLHRSVLLHNRGQVRAALGRDAEAVADFSAVIAADPNHPEYYFDRAALYRRMGDADAALADYQTAIDISPPFPEAYYNRGDLRAETGDVEGALADFGHVLELEPDYLDARINRATLLLQEGLVDAAADEVVAGLVHHPASPDLLCTRGLIALELGDPDGARTDFDAVLEQQPDHHQALANRAVAAVDLGRHADALNDLDRALEITGPDAALLYNRGYVHRVMGRWREAEQDFSAALELPGADLEALVAGRDECLAELGR
jgi:tetratricopeptide (TPR) repeat protein